jgi:hypothetical protein
VVDENLLFYPLSNIPPLGAITSFAVNETAGPEKDILNITINAFHDCTEKYAKYVVIYSCLFSLFSVIVFIYLYGLIF